MRKVLFLLLIVIMLIGNASASLTGYLKDPVEYGNNQCELIAKDYQAVYGGSLIWIQPLKSNGAYDLGEYSAHIINKAYNPEIGIYYMDFQTETIMDSLDDVHDWYYIGTGKHSQIWDLGISRPEFGLIWHY